MYLYVCLTLTMKYDDFLNLGNGKNKRQKEYCAEYVSKRTMLHA